jgi:TolB-like protein/DNA-binding winged helix-turn-helix (wHTH) protein/Flp pilus assembly protein TadD
MLVERAVQYKFDDFRVDVDKQELFKNGKSVTLSHKAFQVLLLLVRRPNQIVEKEYLLSEIWHDSFVEESNLTQYVHILRKALGQNKNVKAYIETINKIGYRFTADVQTIGDAPPDEAKSLDSDIEEWNAAGRDYRKMPVNRMRFGQKGLLATFVLAVLAIGSIYFFQRQNKPQTPVLHIKSLAVLPFKPIDEESRNAKLGLGMADAVITRLSRLNQISVRPTSAIFKLAEQQSGDSPVIIGRSLQVDAVLEGTVQRDQNRIRITVQIIDVADGKSLWAESFNEDYTNIFEIQDSISRKVAESLLVNLTSRDEELLARRSTTNQEAYQAYLLGIHLWNKRTKEGLLKAEAHFKQAIEIDPNYAPAYAGLADAYNMLAYYKYAAAGESYEKSKAAALKALELDNSLGEAYVALALVQSELDGDEAAARKSLETAIKFAPYSAIARQRYAWNLAYAGRLDDSVGEMRLAQEYDPLSAVNNGALCNLLVFQRKYDEAGKFCRRAAELAPELLEAHISLGESYLFAGRYADAADEFNRALETGRDDAYALASLGYLYANTGRASDAEKVVEKLTPLIREQPSLCFEVALINYSLGKKDGAFSMFEKAFEMKVLSVTSLRYSPRLDKIKTEPRFIELLKRHQVSDLMETDF